MRDMEFDQFADNYREIHTQNVQGVSGQDSDYFSEYKIIEIKKRLGNRKINSFLDLGCGDGNTAKFVCQNYPGVLYTGLDVSKESIRVAESRELNHCKFKYYNGQHIPYEDEVFDVVFLACVMHHVDVKDRCNLLEEAYRVLKKHGCIIIFEHNPINPVTRKIVKDCPFDEGVTLLFCNHLRKMLKKTGFKGKAIWRYTIFIPRKGLLEKLVWIEQYLWWIPLGGQYYCVVYKE